MAQALPPGSTIGILGSGQLGRMLALAAARLGLKTHVYSDGSGPAFDVAAATTLGGYDDADRITAFAKTAGVVTFEFENVPMTAAAAAEQVAPFRPGHRALGIAQDRYQEKRFLEQLGIPVAPFAKVDSPDDFAAALQATDCPAILKTRRLGYDGKGQQHVGTASDLPSAFTALSRRQAILEAIVPFTFEVSVIAVRSSEGDVQFYDMPHNTHRDGILAVSSVPSGLAARTIEQGRDITRKIADGLDYIGVLTVELFVLGNGGTAQLIVNEMAPRVHNSGHWTIEACLVSQFENHIRAVAGWPLGSTQRHSDAVMTNLIGPEAAWWGRIARHHDTGLHLYGKNDARAGRKMGHFTKISPLTKDGSD